MTPNGFPRSRLLLALAIAVPLAVLGDAIWVRTDPEGPPWQGLDDWWNGLVGSPVGSPLWYVAECFNLLGGALGLVLGAVAVVALLVVRRWRSAVYVGAALAATKLVTDGLKAVAERPRPTDITVDTGSWAFPSGHASRMAAVVVVIAVLMVPARHLQRWWPVAVVLTCAMMLARNWQHAHWLTDTVAGAATGAAVAVFVWWALSPLLDRERALREGVALETADSGTQGTGSEHLS
ncbi:phosphatase PAP2 family protein [Glycomyces luteolus]|uniref:Phosphatase PAP2 family protein n=1 Tax=Glycomyces luteolus TaxID=2670330 RepID=A0A9X3SPV6_9ACTN|nr:phosphatase PAP2 family protein [Glycomyces luteolus]MDA1358259.1 phosphatase PAP2 family protein [Glycomyces luteolus]